MPGGISSSSSFPRGQGMLPPIKLFSSMGRLNGVKLKRVHLPCMHPPFLHTLQEGMNIAFHLQTLFLDSYSLLQAQLFSHMREADFLFLYHLIKSFRHGYWNMQAHAHLPAIIWQTCSGTGARCISAAPLISGRTKAAVPSSFKAPHNVFYYMQ